MRFADKMQNHSVASTASPWKVFGLTSVAVFLVSLDATILFVAFGAIQQTFSTASSAQLSWVLNAYTIVYAALLVPSGRLADVHGHRKIFLLGVALFTLASALCALAPSPALLIGARMLQAAGAALLTPSSLSLVLAAFPPAKRAVAVSLWGAVGGLAAAVGPSAGASLITAFGWEAAFYINIPIGIISILRGRRSLAEHRSSQTGTVIDLPGILLLVGGVGLISLGVVQSEEWGATAAKTILSVIAGLALLLIFALWSKKSPSPALDLSLFQNRSYLFVNIATFCFSVAFTIMFFGAFFYLTHIWGYSLSRAGLAVSPGPLMVIPVAIMAGKVAARFGHQRVLVPGALIYALGGAWFYFSAQSMPDYLGTWLPGILLTGLGVGMVLPSLSGAAAHQLPSHRFGVGVAVNTAIRQLGSVFGVAITVLLVADAGHSLAAFHTLYACLIGGGLVTALLCLAVNTRPAIVLSATQAGNAKA